MPDSFYVRWQTYWSESTDHREGSSCGRLRVPENLQITRRERSHHARFDTEVG